MLSDPQAEDLFRFIFNQTKPKEMIYCHVPGMNSVYESHFFCNSSNEKCCDTGCCASGPIYYQPMVWILLATVLFTIFYCVCRLKIKNERSNTQPEHNITMRIIVNRSSVAVHHLEEGTDNTVRDPEMTASILEQEDGNMQVADSNHHQVTPPPNYEAALSAPLRYPEDTVPSYEDAMRDTLM